jgi:hypothetical protein
MDVGCLYGVMLSLIDLLVFFSVPLRGCCSTRIPLTNITSTNEYTDNNNTHTE